MELQELDDAVAKGAILVDIRPEESRTGNGEMPGAHIIDRNVLLWRLSPSSATRSLDLSTGSRVIVFCNDGYASSIAATQLQDVGLPLATDLVGGYNAWKNAQA